MLDHDQRIHTDPDKVHRVDFDGQWYRTAGPLCVMPGPQGRPMLAQAGTSDAGRTVAATHAEMIFVPPLGDDEHLAATIADLRTRASDAGRDPAELRIVFTHGGAVAESEAQARETQATILARPGHEANVVSLSHSAGFDLSGYPPSTWVSEIVDRVTGMRGPWVDAAGSTDPTLEEFGQRLQNAAADERFVGTPVQVADALEAQTEATDCDGFQFSPTYYAPDYFRDLVDLLIPELQRRGRAATDYPGSTLRERLYA